MKTLFSFLKILGVGVLLWFAASMFAVGRQSTGLSVAVLMFIVGVVALVGVIWLLLYLLKRDAHFNLHGPLVVLLVCAMIVLIVVAQRFAMPEL